jgi:hypothetical protein
MPLSRDLALLPSMVSTHFITTDKRFVSTAREVRAKRRAGKARARGRGRAESGPEREAPRRAGGWICPPCGARLCSRCADWQRCNCPHANPAG